MTEELQEAREKYIHMSYKELGEQAQKIALSLIGQYPNTWKTKLKSNVEHKAIFQLMKEVANG